MSAYIRVASANQNITVPQYFEQAVVSPTQKNVYYMDGNVGIGQAVPTSKLVVDGSTSIGYPTTAAPTNGLIVSGNVGIGTNNPTVKMDVNGNVNINGLMKSSNPYFYVYKNNGNVNAVTNVVFNIVIHNLGGHYNNSNGRFTAPVNGFYLFTFNTISNTNPVEIRFRLNDIPIDGTEHYSNAGNGVYTDISASIVYYLTANQYVNVYVTAGNFYGQNYNSFSGCLLG